MKPGIVLCIGTREERQRIARWLKSNGGHPNRTPEWSRIIVTGNRIIVTEAIFQQRRRGGKWWRKPSSLDQNHVDTRQRTYRIRYDLKDIE